MKDILDLIENPSTIHDICAKSKYSRATIYRRISELLDACLLFTIRKQDKNFGRCGPWIYVKLVYSISMKSGRMSYSCDCTDTLIEILPKRRFYGQILKMIRDYRL
jgi:predicted transcriptional regulator